MTASRRSLPLFFALLLAAGCSTPVADDASATTHVDDNDPPTNEEPLPQSEEDKTPLSPDTSDDELSDYDRPPPYDREYDISEVYAQMCASCHGEDGDGDGHLEAGFAFDSPKDQWSNGPTVSGILDTLEDGIHDTAMRDFPEFKDIDRVELAEYILDLRRALDSSL